MTDADADEPVSEPASPATGATPEGAGLAWLLEDLVTRLAGGEQAVVLSSDGLPVTWTANLPRDDAEHLSAVSSGLHSLARGASRHFDGGQVQQTVVEMDNRMLLVTAAGQGASLALLADADADLGMIAYEVNLLVKQVGSYLRTSVRGPADR